MTNAIIGGFDTGGLPYIESDGSPKVDLDYNYLSGVGYYERYTITQNLMCLKNQVPTVIRLIEKSPDNLTTYAGFESTGVPATATEWGAGFSILKIPVASASASFSMVSPIWERSKHSMFGSDLPVDAELVTTGSQVKLIWKGTEVKAWDSGHGEEGVGLDLELADIFFQAENLNNGQTAYQFTCKVNLLCNGIAQEGYEVEDADFENIYGPAGEGGIAGLPLRQYARWNVDGDKLEFVFWDKVFWSVEP